MCTCHRVHEVQDDAISHREAVDQPAEVRVGCDLARPGRDLNRRRWRRLNSRGSKRCEWANALVGTAARPLPCSHPQPHGHDRVTFVAWVTGHR